MPGQPLVLIHGFTDTPRTWDAVLPRLREHFEVHLPTLLGHCGGDPLPADMRSPLRAMADALERFMDERGLERAHIAGNSLGGLLTLVLAGSGRAISATALAPSGGWEEQRIGTKIARRFVLAHRLAPVGARLADRIAARPRLRKLALRDVARHGERIAPATAAALIRGAADCPMYEPLIRSTGEGAYRLDVGTIDVPVRVVWGRQDRILPLRTCAAYYRTLTAAGDWVELDDVGHLIQLDAPEHTAELIIETAARAKPVAVPGR